VADPIDTRRENGLEASYGLDDLIGRQEDLDRIRPILRQGASGSQGDCGGRVAGFALQEQPVAEVREDLLRRSSEVVSRHYPEPGREGKTLEPPSRTLQERLSFEDGKHLLGACLAAQGPESHAGATGHDHCVDIWHRIASG